MQWHGWTYCHTEWSKSDRKGQTSYDIAYTYVEYFKNGTNEPIYKTEIES